MRRRPVATDLPTVRIGALPSTTDGGGWTGMAVRRAVELWGAVPSPGEALAVVRAIQHATVTGEAQHPTGLHAKRVRGLDARRSEIWRIRSPGRVFLVAWSPDNERVISVLPELRVRRLSRPAGAVSAAAAAAPC